jgi:2,4-dienoyl-CoA reductase-like NADH-dependent reductase (Old Yellow Enzyme family)
MKTPFRKLKINNKYELKNCVAVAPMTTTQSNADGSISQSESDWLVRLSEDNYGMVITCAASISETSTAFYNQLSLGHDMHIPELKIVTDKLKKNGSVNIVQLCHAGSRAIEELAHEKPHSASSYGMPMIPDFIPPRELSITQIHQIITDFANACIRAEKAGFDGVEFHGANGYLFTQFISRMTNLRKDHYGGRLENRSRFAREVVQACRNAVSDDFILGFRISFENVGLETGLDIDENIQIVNWLTEDGIDYTHMSHLDFTSNSVKYPKRNALQYVKSKISNSIPLIGVGGITNVSSAEQAMEFGADIIAIGRAAIGNKHLPELFEKGEELLSQNPFSESRLIELGISRNFINYLRKMPVASLNVVL